MKPLTIEPMAIARLRPFPGNARTHSKKQIRQIADSIARFGFTNPVLIDDDDKIIAGHGRLEAAKLLGLKSVPTLRLSGLDATERRAYALADNKLALNAGWDRGALAVELRALADLQFDAEVTGFSCAEIELVLDAVPEGRGASDAKTSPQRSCSVRCEEASLRRNRAADSSPPPCGEGSGVGVVECGTVGPPPPDPPPQPSPSRNRVYASFGHSIKRSKSATAYFDRGEGVAAARIALARRRENGAPATVTRGDDLWRLDRHRILCADPHDLTTIDRMLGGERLVFVTFEPELCDQIVRHFRQLTGQDATLAASGQSFADVAAQRKQEPLR